MKQTKKTNIISVLTEMFAQIKLNTELLKQFQGKQSDEPKNAGANKKVILLTTQSDQELQNYDVDVPSAFVGKMGQVSLINKTTINGFVNTSSVNVVTFAALPEKLNAEELKVGWSLGVSKQDGYQKDQILIIECFDDVETIVL